MALIEQGAAQVIKAEIAWHRDMEARARECMETAGETDKEQYIVSCRIAAENRKKAQALEWALKKALSTAASVAHGRWVKHDGYTECSECEYWYDSAESEDAGDRSNYCPNYGARMDEGEGHEAD